MKVFRIFGVPSVVAGAALVFLAFTTNSSPVVSISEVLARSLKGFGSCVDSIIFCYFRDGSWVLLSLEALTALSLPRSGLEKGVILASHQDTGIVSCDCKPDAQG
ncbi:hypothetical protein NE237_018156 [Protea cynaroides]|uniref:Uncharacterized protein n=1 Tax=Protea cynaroides TaxID=273540 RepID=A0A9Q0K9F3_9MAGN|nr:hypothetical protein NE237_018156 [Protea cynaroides]